MLLLLALTACLNDCRYFERCDGDTLLVCGGGPDQQIGRTENPFPCEAPNEVCVEVGENNATCAASADLCADGSAATCEGDLWIECLPFSSSLGLYGSGSEVSTQQATDCAEQGLTCDDTQGCVSSP